MSVYVDDPALVQRVLDTAEDRSKVYKDIDSRGFSWYIWAVSATGLFADSYSFFSMDTAFPAIAYVFWNGDVNSDNWQSTINELMLTGFLVGQISFGHLADRSGRLKLYGYSLIATVFGTVFLMEASTGVKGSLSIMAMLGCWRFLTGFGTGANSSLSVIIAAECTSTRSRARMLAGVFLMRSLGQLATALIGFVALAIVKRNKSIITETEHRVAAPIIDVMWRIVLGVGMLPTLFAYVLSLTKSETPRYSVDAAEKRLRILRSPTLPEAPEDSIALGHRENRFLSIPSIGAAEENENHEISPLDKRSEINLARYSQPANSSHISAPSPGRNTWIEELPTTFSREGMKQYFWVERNWKLLAGTCICWFALEFTFSSLKINDSRTVSQLWGSQNNGTSVRSWLEWSQQNESNLPIYQALQHDVTLLAISTCLGPVAGSVAFIALVDYVPRRKAFGWSFLGLAILFVFTGVLLLSHAHENLQATQRSLYVICQVVFNFGLLPLIFIIPTEVFPTRYRGTCYTISAAFGTFGRIVSSFILPENNLSSQLSSKLGLKLVVNCIFMMVGAVATWKWIPEIDAWRDPGSSLRRPNKRLETLEDDFTKVVILCL